MPPLELFDRCGRRIRGASFIIPLGQTVSFRMADTESKQRLLIVEDDPHIRLLLRHLLNTEYDLELAESSAEALAQAQAQPFDLFLIDINLGEDRTGLDVLDTLRRMPAYATTPMVACTAYALHGDHERFLAHGFDAYVDKPFVPAVLRDTIREVLSEDVLLVRPQRLLGAG